MEKNEKIIITCNFCDEIFGNIDCKEQKLKLSKN